MRARPPRALLLLILLLVCAPALAQDIERERQSIRDLLEAWLRSRPDRRRVFEETQLSLGQGESGIGAVVMRGGGQLLDFGDRGDEDESEGLAGLLAELLRRHALSKDNDGEWSLRDGALTVRDGAAARARVRGLIEQLRAAFKVRIELELRLLRAAELPAPLREAELGRPLDARARAALNALRGPKADRPRLRLLLYEEESGQVDATRRIGVLEGYEINQTGVVPVAKPIAGAVKAGVLAAARAARIPGGGVHLDLRLEWARFEGLRSLEVPGYGPLELPRIELLRLGTSLRLDENEPTLIARVRDEGEGRGAELAVVASLRVIAPKAAPLLAGREARRYALDGLGAGDDFRFAIPWRPRRGPRLIGGVLNFDYDPEEREGGPIPAELKQAILDAAGSKVALEDSAEAGLFLRRGSLLVFAEPPVQARIAAAIKAWYRGARRGAVFEYGELRRAAAAGGLEKALDGPARRKRRLEIAGIIGANLRMDWHRQAAMLEALPRYQSETMATPTNERLPDVVRRVVPDGIFLSLRGAPSEDGLRVGARLHRWAYAAIEDRETAVGTLQRVVGLQHFAVQRLAESSAPLLLSKRAGAEETLIWARGRYLEETR